MCVCVVVGLRWWNGPSMTHRQHKTWPGTIIIINRVTPLTMQIDHHIRSHRLASDSSVCVVCRSLSIMLQEEGGVSLSSTYHSFKTPLDTPYTPQGGVCGLCTQLAQVRERVQPSLGLWAVMSNRVL